MHCLFFARLHIWKGNKERVCFWLLDRFFWKEWTISRLFLFIVVFLGWREEKNNAKNNIVSKCPSKRVGILCILREIKFPADLLLLKIWLVRVEILSCGIRMMKGSLKWVRCVRLMQMIRWGIVQEGAVVVVLRDHGNARLWRTAEFMWLTRFTAVLLVTAAFWLRFNQLFESVVLWMICSI